MKVLTNLFKKFGVIYIYIFLVSCSFSYNPKLVIEKELTAEYLQRLNREYGSNKIYYFIASNKSLVEFDSSHNNIRDQVAKYAFVEIRKSGVCKSDPVLDKTGSWFDERDDIYINFFCKSSSE